MKDIPIIFSSPMVKALLGGRKTMTRRLAWGKPQGVDIDEDAARDMRRDGWKVSGPDDTDHRIAWPPTVWQKIKPGDRLWVRESLQCFNRETAQYIADITPVAAIDDVDRAIDGRARWIWKNKSLPSIHMPRWASRITLIVTATKIEPLRDISEADAAAEGFEAGQLNDGFGPRDFGGGFTVESLGTYASAAGMFQITWTKLHPEWDGYSSPDVVALTFTVHKQNIDTMAKEAA